MNGDVMTGLTSIREAESHDGGLYLVLISVHGLIRAEQLELGRDSDTGGQTLYVVELAKALAKHPKVERVDLITRRVVDSAVSKDYARRIEPLAEGCQIVRIESGPDEYLPKEQLWPFMTVFADNTLSYLSAQPRMPDVIHSHYADAGYVGTKISQLTEIPLVHTGHSLGRDKRRRMLASGLNSESINKQFNINKRIEAEESTLACARLVVTSTKQEITDQYEMYDFYKPDSMDVIPPGTDLERFSPPRLGDQVSEIELSIRKMLTEPDKPVILALSRPDPRKNIQTLVEAYGKSKELQEKVNLVIVAGTRDDIRKMEEHSQGVFTDLFTLVDVYDLYGKVALPKSHRPDDVPDLYRFVAQSGGVFVNPALTEPFGLTLIEAAACGLPFVATEVGGPVDIVKNCQSGLLVNPLDSDEMAEKILWLVNDHSKWREYSSNGLKHVKTKYSWTHHARDYVEKLEDILAKERLQQSVVSTPMSEHSLSRMLVLDLETLIASNEDDLSRINAWVKANKKQCAIAVVTNRRFDNALKLMNRLRVLTPDVLISSRGTNIHYSPNYKFSVDWFNHADYNWNPRALKREFARFDCLKLQEESEQSRLKLSYDIVTSDTEALESNLYKQLRKNELSANLTITNGTQLDVTPVRCSTGMAVRYVAQLWDIALENILICLEKNSNQDLLFGASCTTLLNNSDAIQDMDYRYHKVFKTTQKGITGVFESLEHFDFMAPVIVSEKSDSANEDDSHNRHAHADMKVADL